MSYLKQRPGSIEEVITKLSSKVLESDYQDKFKKELDKTGKGIGSMTPAEKKAFFNKIDKMHNAKDEQATSKEIDKFHKKLDNLVHKSFGHSSDEKKKEMKEEVHPHVKKMVKDGESDEKIKKMHPELKDDELEKLKETHMSTAKSQNQKQREVGGEKEPIKTPKNEWKTFAMMAAELREKKEEKKEQEAGEDTRDMKKKTMTGQVATSPEMNPRVDYKY